MNERQQDSGAQRIAAVRECTSEARINELRLCLAVLLLSRTL